VKAFCHGSSLGMKHVTITLNCRQNNIRLHYPSTHWKKLKATPSAGKVMTTVLCFLGCRMGDFDSRCAMWSGH